MYCESCKIKIKGKANHCPLCGQKLDDAKSGVITSITSAEEETKKTNVTDGTSSTSIDGQDCGNEQKLLYPMPKVRRQVLDQFSKIYLAVITLIIAVCLTINIVHNDKFMWSVVVMVCLIYVFYLIRFTLIAQGRFNAQIFGQAIALTAVFVAVRIIFGGNDWIFIAWLPIVYFISTLLILVYIGVEWRDVRKKLMSLITMAVLGIVPICNAYFLDLSVKWPSIAVSSFSAIVIVVAVIAGRKLILGELKRFVHL